MNHEEFVIEQFRTLRAEIAEKRQRRFKFLTVGSITPLLSLYGLIGYNEALQWIILFLPLLVLVFTLLHQSDKRDMIRCGCYIRTEIEPLYKDKILGWESWLEQKKSRRETDKSFAFAYSILYLVYYLITATIAIYQAAELIHSIVALIAIATSYFLLLIWLFRIITSGSRNKAMISN